MTDILGLNGKKFLIVGVANRKSVAWHVAKRLTEAGATCVYVVRDQTVKDQIARLTGDAPIYCCNVESQEEIDALATALAQDDHRLDGMLHSIAFADFSEGMKPFHETPRKAFLQAVDISCFSLVALSSAVKDLLTETASVVTVSISTTTMASENYGYMAPIKAALDSSLAFLTKSFSRFSKIRFNAVAPGLLKTSASAGIPGYVDSYLYAEKVIPRGEAVTTDEAAAVAMFLLSPMSSGVCAQKIIVDAAMSTNYFDADIISQAMRE